MRRLVVDMQSSAPHMRLPGWAADEITANTPDGWEVVHVATQSRSLGNGTNEPSAETLAAIPAAEAYFGYGLTPALLAAAPALRWAHSASAGIGESITPELRESRVVFTNGAGIYAEPMADTVLGGVLHFVRGLDLAVRLQAASIWDRHPFVDNNGGIRELSEYRVLVIGAGGIGSAVAQRLQALGCECIGVRRRPALGVPAGFTRVVGPDALDEVLPLGDITVVAAPLTDGTRSLLDGARMALLPAGAIVVNVARGPLVDDAALLEGLESGRLRGAVLDVFSTEPLPADSPWWQHPRVLVTPHVSGVSPQRTWQRGLALFMDNWRRWSAGERLHNVVDLDAGY